MNNVNDKNLKFVTFCLEEIKKLLLKNKYILLIDIIVTIS